jgi:FtsP/CotA-like multicopper oxidase with cupredoxin domain
MKRTSLASLVLGPALLLGALLAPGTAAAAGPITSTACAPVGPGITCNLWAESGTLTLPVGTTTIWGFSQTDGGSPSLPGPTLIVNQGDAVTVNLVNHLGVATSILFGGQPMVPDQAGAAAAGGTKTYTFTATRPGTYLYEAGLIPGSEYQVAMGLHGVLIVRPTGQPFQAYADAATAFNDEALVVVSEIDPVLNNSATPWTVDLRAYAPKWFLMNGHPFTGAASSITTVSGNKLLLRYANAGIQHHSLGVLGLHQAVLSADGSELPAPRTMVAETLAPGQTADVLVTVPATAATSTKYALYDAALALNNSSASGIGGMLAIIDASGTAGGDVVGPATTGVTLTETAPGSGLYTVTASVSDASSGGANVAAAEYRIDGTGATPTAMSATDLAFDSTTEAVTSATGAIDASAWSSGTHAVYVRGQDALGNWGANVSATIVIDRTGPTTSGLTLNPNPSSGSVPVALAGTASDAATGNNNIVDAEYWIGAPGANGSGTHLARNKTAAVVSITGSIPAPGTSGVVSVHSKDSAGNWGPYATINLTVDGQGPVTSSVSAIPPANNGSYAQSSTSPSVRVFATFDDATTGGSRIGGGEGFVDTVGTFGTGFPFSAVDGVFDEVNEPSYADIPLSTINQLTTGSHLIRVHGRDAVGSWGVPLVDLSYLIDRTAPTFTSISLSPSPTYGAPTVTLTVNGATDPVGSGPASGVAGGEYWVGTTVPAAGSGTKFIGLTPSIPTSSLPVGTDTIGVRVRDIAGNWSVATHSATVVVVPDLIFSNGFETGAVNSNWGWSSRSTGTASRLTVTTTSPIIGTRKLVAQGNNGNYVQFNFGTTAQPVWPTFDARFYFNPNGNTSGGQDIFQAAASSSNTNLNNPRFHVRYRMSSGQSQVQIQVGATANATWTNLNNAANNRIEVVWQSGATLQLYVNGTLGDTLTATSSSIGALRLGSVTSGGSNILEYFDGFTAKRTVSPLIGTGP